MPTKAYAKLFKPLSIKGLRLKNRITMAPLYLSYAAAGGKVSALLLYHYRQMAAGGAAQIPSSLFDPVRPLPATIAAEMGETPYGSEHYHALFAIGITLFLMTLIFNLVAAYISHRFHQKGSATL